MRFFTLIHIEREEKSLHNNSFVHSFDEQITLYLSCAKQLHLSLKTEGIELVIITNDKAFLDKLNKDNYPIEILEINFTLNVPSGVRFFSAHFKIEIYKYLSSLQDEYLGLIDCDIVCVNKIPACFRNLIDLKVALYYDITEQVMPAYTAERVISDKERLSGTSSIGMWAGGEFLSGTPSFFGRLYEEIEPIKLKYFNNFNTFRHQGSEMLTSVAIENMILRSDVRILDAGTLSIIGRFWSPKPMHIQKPVDAYSNHFLFHIPSDKKFIKSLSPDKLKGDSFFKEYKQHVFIFRLLESTFKGIKPYVKSVKRKINNLN